MADPRSEAALLAEALRQSYETQGFKVFWNQVIREHRRAQLWLRAARQDVYSRNGGAEALGIEVARREGFLECMEKVIEVKDELLDALDRGRIPWKETRR